ncbi:Long-flagella protein, kinase, CMGC RCK [Spironucleus salmonicida]|uniref:Long-flagella protein, kinase, CMGC RCK n=1 Tax=Spironucleus salmonicida TaxID=348837 RepID=V6LSM6_9EUKA|nr:Long-flagella protein, kinase, CMGC RCK [Spironucleus salmonicida]|eukprot:EST46681.1 Long-flagella protein, kinase, CMGC RCK [Spironucleus salmonicida]
MPNQPSKSKYKFLAKKGAGAFADVIEALNTTNQERVAIKRMKQPYESVEQITKLKELKVLKNLRSKPNIVQLQEILFDRASGKLALVFELLDMNLYEIIKDLPQPLPANLAKFYCFQAACSLATLHENHFFHRDIKPENFLMKKYGNAFVLKLADFGSATEKTNAPPLTEYISTRWYRAPEILLTDGDYSFEIDIFALGCVFFEVCTNFPLFPGKDEVDQLQRIHKVCGVPGVDVFTRIRRNATRNPIKTSFMQQQGVGVGKWIKNKDASHTIEGMIQYDPKLRMTIQDVLASEWFADMGQILEVVKGDLPAEHYELLRGFVSKRADLPGVQAKKTSYKVKREPTKGHAAQDNGIKLPTIVVKGQKAKQ